MQTRPAYQPLTDAVNQVIETGLAEKRIHGAVVVIAHNGQTVYHHAAGYADPEKRLPMQRHSLFRLASITKAFTSLAAAALIEQGKMQLDDPVTRWLPDFTPATADGKTPVITIRQLLSHTAGLDYRWAQPENGPYAQAGVSDGLDISGLSLEENLRRLASAPLIYEPGASWQYSLAPEVMGAVVARACGTSFPEAMQALVTGPLGMTDTAFYITEKERGRTTIPHCMENGILKPMAEKQLVINEDGWHFLFSPERAWLSREYPSGGVGLIGTGADLIRLVEAIRTDTMPTVSKPLMERMSANILPNGMPRDPSAGFGLGWGILLNPALAQTPQSPGTRYWGGVYGCKWFADPAKKLSVVIMTTTAASVRNDPVSTGIRNAIYASLPQ
ncbi:MAG: beta-lactamase family protein [Alistipes senegalensis]|nr:beta-lactamase family protein [Oxalobacter formigenes]MCM1280733.1 beta-lactamase family protein [Alistipes senegalensis]